MSDAPSPTPPSEPPRQGRWRLLRWPRRILAIIGIAVVVLLLVQIFVLPRVVRAIVHRALTDFGFENVSFDVQRVSLVHTDIADFRLDGEGINRIGGLSADYTLRTLLDGRIKSLRIQRAEIQVTIAKDGSIDVGPLDLRAKDDAQPPTDGRLPFDRLELVDSTLNLAWEERRIVMPLRGTVWDLGGGRSSVELVADIAGEPLQINGTFEALGRDMKISAEGDNWRIADVLAAVPARLGADLPPLMGQIDLEASYSKTAEQAQAAGSLRARLIPVAEEPTDELSVTGLIRIQADVLIRGDRVEPRITISTKDLDLRGADGAYALRGIMGSVVLDGLGPLKSPAGQRLTIAEADIGQLKLRDGVLSFEVADSTAVSVASMQANWASGQIVASPFRFDLQKPVIESTLTLENIDLQQMLEAFGEGKVSGRGIVSGRVPMRLSWPATRQRDEMVTDWSELRVALGEGYLHAQPGGHLSFADPEAALGDVLEKQDPRFRQGGSMANVKKRLMDALHGLNYRVLRLDIFREDDDLIARLHLSGKGQGRDGQEIGGVTVNLHNFDQMLRQAVFLQELLTRSN